jgi:ElaB/YqjD/DUF883 family membrane-anchored ribosome-binding protein
LDELAVFSLETKAYLGRTERRVVMPDESQIRKKVLLRTLGSPLVLAPFVLGMTALTAVWATGLRAGLAVFAGLAGLLGAVGIFVTRLVFKGETLARNVTEEMARQDEESAQQALDQLDQALSVADEDPRPEAALRDLRALLKAFEEVESSANRVHLPTVVEIRARVNELFRQCVQSLGQTNRLWQTAKKLSSPAARKPLLAQREKIIAEVETTVKQLSHTLVGVQGLGASEGSSAELARLRDELDQNLEIARTVEERVQSLLTQTDTADLRPAQPNLKMKG